MPEYRFRYRGSASNKLQVHGVTAKDDVEARQKRYDFLKKHGGTYISRSFQIARTSSWQTIPDETAQESAEQRLDRFNAFRKERRKHKPNSVRSGSLH